MNTHFMRADEVAKELDISKAYAYTIIRKLNEELESQGMIVISGRLSRKYFEERFNIRTSYSKEVADECI